MDCGDCESIYWLELRRSWIFEPVLRTGLGRAYVVRYRWAFWLLPCALGCRSLLLLLFYNILRNNVLARTFVLFVRFTAPFFNFTNTLW